MLTNCTRRPRGGACARHPDCRRAPGQAQSLSCYWRPSARPGALSPLCLYPRARRLKSTLGGSVPRASAVLSPRDPLIYSWCHWIGQAHLLQSRTDEAIVWLEKARSANPAFPGTHGWLAAAYALKGENKRAADELAEARRVNADDRYSTIARLRAMRYWGVPKIRALVETIYFAGLRKAGMPEE